MVTGVFIVPLAGISVNDLKKTMQKPLEMTMGAEYGELVTAKSVAGFDSPLPKADAPPQLSVRRFFCVHCAALLLLGGGVRGASCPPVPLARSVNPHISALFAFDSAKGGYVHAKGACL